MTRFVFRDIDGVVVVDSVCRSKDLGFIVLGVGLRLLDSRPGDQGLAVAAWKRSWVLLIGPVLFLAEDIPDIFLLLAG